MSTKKSSRSSKITAAEIDWAAEINQTLKETGWSKAELASWLGLYVQNKSGTDGGPVSPHLYTWLRGKHKPKVYLLYALRYLRGQYGLASMQAAKAPTKPKE